MSNYFVKNAEDGDAVATAIGLYVNSYDYPTEKFYTCMQSAGKNVQYNFTVLCLEWFQKLSEIRIYDERNEASVWVAQRIASEISCENLTRKKMAKTGILPECSFDFQSDADAVWLIEKFLRLSENNEAFIYTMLHNTHRTIQQNFSRLCLNWLKRASEFPEQRRRYVILAKKAAKHYCYLPLV